MSGSANNSAYSNSGMGNQPWGSGPTWNQSPWSYWRWQMLPRPLCIAAVVLGFIVWWPVGLFLLLTSMWGGRLSCWGHRRNGGYQGGASWQDSVPPWTAWRNWCSGGEQPAPTSGNRAFDEYRVETLRRLEEEQKEFAAFLDRLRFAKDKAEFDQFMAELRQRPSAPPEPPQG